MVTGKVLILHVLLCTVVVTLAGRGGQRGSNFVFALRFLAPAGTLGMGNARGLIPLFRLWILKSREKVGG